MHSTSLTIDGVKIEAPAGAMLLQAAEAAGIYIPRLCSHPDLPPIDGDQPSECVYWGDQRVENLGGDQRHEACRLCLVQVEGREAPVRACSSLVEPGLTVLTDTAALKAQRQAHLAAILARHPHACLTCAQREGCSRTQCSADVPEAERCCSLLGDCELQRVADYIGIPSDLPRYIPAGLPRLIDGPLFTHDYNLCIGCLRCVRVCRELRGVEALSFVYGSEGEILVGELAPSLAESFCRFCTACVEVCPTGTLMDRRADGVALRLKGEEQLIPCRSACPAHTDVPRYVRLAGEGRFAQAAAVVRERAPFPAVLGHVCFHPCEEVCLRGDLNAPICIAAIKRCAGERDDGAWLAQARPGAASHKRVAVVGAGPAGLTAAYFLALKGHVATVFEAQDEPGGMLRYGIPEYRLPREVLQREIQLLLEVGIQLRTGVRVGSDIEFPALQADYEAVVLALGLQLSRRLELPGLGLEGVWWGLEFLREVNSGGKPEVGERAVVIGGGGVAMDAALIARRLGARDVQLACLETLEQMPAHRREIELVLEEGVSFNPSWGPRAVLGNGRVQEIKLVHCTSVFDCQGRFNPSYDETVTKVLQADTVILAIGQAADLRLLNGSALHPDPESGGTGLPGAFVAGDLAGGQLSVVHAIASGRRAAEAADRHLGGDGLVERPLLTPEPARGHLGRVAGFAAVPGATLPRRPLSDRRVGFGLIELGLAEQAALVEARRCLQCDLRFQLGANPHPPQDLLPFDAEHVAQVPAEGGVYLLRDSSKDVLQIAGTLNLRQALQEQLDAHTGACFFSWEADPLYTKRESELIQQYVQEHGHLPGAGLGLDELYEDMDDQF